MAYQTEEEKFWSGEFGGEYIKRNCDSKLIIQNYHFFSRALSKAVDIRTCLEFGANIGLNIKALMKLFPECNFSALELNERAVRTLNEINNVKVIHESVLEFNPNNIRYDLVLSKGLLIHINPKKLKSVYEIMYQSSSKYILISEYFNPEPITLDYYGHKEKLYKRDFAGEILDKFKDLVLIDYGFNYNRDKFSSQDDTTFFLLQKSDSIS